MEKAVNAGPSLYPYKSLERTGQESLRNKNRRKKRMLTAQMAKPTDPMPTETPLQKQTGGTHYKGMAIQPAEYAEKNGLSLLEGNVVKYITRWKLKGQPLSDLEKAKHCIDLLIEIHNVK